MSPDRYELTEIPGEPETPISQRAKDLEGSPLDEETISRIADESFLEYDTQEADRPGPASE
jgi:hypothetical protein